jgi:hypothetical protein
MISDTLSDAHSEIRRYFDEPDGYTDECFRAWCESVLASMDALRRYLDGHGRTG